MPAQDMALNQPLAVSARDNATVARTPLELEAALR